MINWKIDHYESCELKPSGNFKWLLKATVLNGKFKEFTISDEYRSTIFPDENSFLVLRHYINEIYDKFTKQEPSLESGRLVDIK